MNFISQAVNNVLYKAGRRSYAEFWVKQFPAEYQVQAKQKLQELSTIETAADPAVYFKKLQELGSFADACQTRSKTLQGQKVLGGPATAFQGGTTMFGYKPRVLRSGTSSLILGESLPTLVSSTGR